MSTGGPAPAHEVFSPAEMVQEVLQSLWIAVSDRPWLLAVVLVALAVRVVGLVRGLIHAGRPRDAVRRFSRADKAAILARAGGLCEHHSMVFGRCARTDALEADHVHPHSRGGWTAIENGQALCRSHNEAKSARVPWNWELDRLGRRRATYFPPGVPTTVARHRPRATAPTPPPESRRPPRGR